MDIKSILLRIFQKILNVSDSELSAAVKDTENYQYTGQVNLTAIIAEKLSKLAFSDSTISVTGTEKEPTKRSLLLNETAVKEWRNVKQNVSVGLGCGMIASIPYSVTTGNGRKIYIDTVTKERIFITSTQGDEITSLTVISDIRSIQQQTYIRWTDYSVENGVYIIRQKATLNGSQRPLSCVSDWAGIAPEIRIGGVKKLPIGIFRCPTSNRRPKSISGVPITYGCEETMCKILTCLTEIEDEYNKKKSKIFADRTMFGKNRKLDAGIYELVAPGGGLDSKALISIFDPAIRDASYYNRLDRLMSQLEKEVGTSKGILTELVTGASTATEIRRAMYDTFCVCDDVHTEAQSYFDNLIYGVDVLANYYGITPPGDYKINYDWSYALIEDSQSTWQMLAEAVSIGAEGKAELRRFNHPNETLEEAQAAIEQIREQDPPLSTLIGE